MNGPEALDEVMTRLCAGCESVRGSGADVAYACRAHELAELELASLRADRELLRAWGVAQLDAEANGHSDADHSLDAYRRALELAGKVDL